MTFIFRWVICFPLISLLMIAPAGLIAAVFIPLLVLLFGNYWIAYAWAVYGSAVIFGLVMTLSLSQHEKDLKNGGTH